MPTVHLLQIHLNLCILGPPQIGATQNNERPAGTLCVQKVSPGELKVGKLGKLKVDSTPAMASPISIYIDENTAPSIYTNYRD